MSTNILGISAFYHDSACCIVVDGKIVAAAQEERFSRKKHDERFPHNAIRDCLKQANLSLSDITHIVFYDKPLLKFERLLETYFSFAPNGFRSFVKAIPIWIKEKLFLKKILIREFSKLKESNTKLPDIYFTYHHQSHAASAFFPSPFEKAAVLCLDGVGEWATTSLWLGEKNKLQPLWEIHFPHSLGLLYSAFTYYAGFKVNSGEYKLMGLAPYGEPRYVDLIYQHLIDVKEDGTYRLNMEYFNYAVGLTMTSRKFDQLFGGPPRKPESLLTQKEMDLARSIQVVTEEIILKIAKTAYADTKCEALCLAGGVALNCVANGRLLKEGPFKKIWVQPAAGDAGGALGAALVIWYETLNNPRIADGKNDVMNGAYLGSEFSDKEILSYLTSINANYQRLEEKELIKKTASLLTGENVIGWFKGRMEFGPRSLGARSIIGDPRSSKMQSVMNLKIKFRESFRPFAPAIKYDKVSDWFEYNESSPYMLFVAKVKDGKIKLMNDADQQLFGIDKLNIVRSEIPSVTHIDYSARLQTVHPETNRSFYELLSEFEAITGCPVLINTSFNVRGEPIVFSPKDAYTCFMRTGIDYLVLGNYLLDKKTQPLFVDNLEWKDNFQLD